MTASRLMPSRSAISACGNPSVRGETGYIDWVPWKEAKLVPCCYLIRIAAWDRTIVNNMSFGHGSHRVSRFQAVEIQ